MMKYQTPSIQIIITNYSSVLCASYGSTPGYISDFGFDDAYDEME